LQSSDIFPEFYISYVVEVKFCFAEKLGFAAKSLSFVEEKVG